MAGVLALSGCSVADDTDDTTATAAPAAPSAAETPATTESPAATETPADTAAPTDTGSATEAPPPSGPGDLSVVSVEPQETLAPVEATEVVRAADTFSVEIALGQTEVTARRPGEIGGEALEVTVLFTNDLAGPRDVSTVSVSVDDADGRPLSPLYGAPYSPLDAQLEPGGSSEGTYVFTLADSTQPFTVRVSAAAEDPIAVFVGSPEQ